MRRQGPYDPFDFAYQIELSFNIVGNARNHDKTQANTGQNESLIFFDGFEFVGGRMLLFLLLCRDATVQLRLRWLPEQGPGTSPDKGVE